MNWNRPKQTIFTNRDNPEAPPGDCWRCCVAAVVQVPAEQVPHFMALNQGDADIQRWLMARGYCQIRFDHPYGYPFIYTPGFHGDPEPLVPIIAIGPTVRSLLPSHQHAVVMVGGKVVYDPHPSDAGLLAVKYGYVITKVFE